MTKVSQLTDVFIKGFLGFKGSTGYQTDLKEKKSIYCS